MTGTPSLNDTERQALYNAFQIACDQDIQAKNARSSAPRISITLPKPEDGDPERRVDIRISIPSATLQSILASAKTDKKGYDTQDLAETLSLSLCGRNYDGSIKKATHSFGGEHHHFTIRCSNTYETIALFERLGREKKPISILGQALKIYKEFSDYKDNQPPTAEAPTGKINLDKGDMVQADNAPEAPKMVEAPDSWVPERVIRVFGPKTGTQNVEVVVPPEDPMTDGENEAYQILKRSVKDPKNAEELAKDGPAKAEPAPEDSQMVPLGWDSKLLGSRDNTPHPGSGRVKPIDPESFKRRNDSEGPPTVSIRR